MLTGFQNLRVAVLCSKRAPALDELLHHPNRGKLYDVACVVTTENSFTGADRIESAGVPMLVHPFRSFFDSRRAPMRHAPTRREYDSVTAQVLKQLGVDTIVLLGYQYILSDAMLEAFPNRILNVHDADLTLTGADGDRRYVGLHSTRDAIAAGECETRSTVHYVTSKVDSGPVLLVSGSYPVAPFAQEAARAGHGDIVKAYAYAHREWMMRDGWGSLVTRSLEYIAAGADGDDLTVVSRMATA
jgi:phosphoribosylglycinamide formyltransferase 1